MLLIRKGSVLMAVVSVLSLALLIPIVSRLGRRPGALRREFRLLRERLAEGRLEGVLERLRQVKITELSGDLRVEAEFLQGLFTIVQSERRFAGIALLSDAWKLVESARTAWPGQERKEDVYQAEIRLADSLVHNDVPNFGLELYEEIYRWSGRPEVLLRQARAHGRAARLWTEGREEAFREARRKVAEYLQVVRPENTIDAAVTLADIYEDYGLYVDPARFIDALGELNRAIDRPEAKSRLGELLLRRARIHLRSGKDTEALRDALAARPHLENPEDREEAAYYSGEVYRRRRIGLANTLLRPVAMTPTPLGAMAQISLARHLLNSDLASALERFQEGLSLLPDASIVTRYAADLNELFSVVRREWEKEPGGDGRSDFVDKNILSPHFDRFISIFREFQRLEPGAARSALEIAGILRMAAERLATAARQEKDVGNEEGAAGLRRRSGEIHFLCAQEVERILHDYEIQESDRTNLLRRQAESFREGGFPVQASRLFRQVYERGRDPKDLYDSAMALVQVRLPAFEGVAAEETLRALEDVASTIGLSSKLGRQAVLEKGRLLSKAGFYEQAAATFQRLTSDHGELSPRDLLWAEALLGRGLAYFDWGRSLAAAPGGGADPRRSTAFEEARKAMNEFLARYARDLPQGESPLKGSVTAAVTLARVSSEPYHQAEALETLRELLAWADRDETEVTSEEAEPYRLASLLLGQLLFQQGSSDEALRVYDRAYARLVGHSDQLVAAVGRVQCNLKMDRYPEARIAFLECEDLLERYRPPIETSTEGFGPAYWNSVLQELSESLGIKRKSPAQ